jgi:hypothetical protein
MSNTEFNGEDNNANAGHVATADAFFARMAEINELGAAPEMCNNALVASGFPPDMCATAHPENFRNGASYPGMEDLPDNHPMLSVLRSNGGIYQNNGLIDSLKEGLGDPAPSLNSAFSAKAGAGYERPQEFDIALESVTTDYKGPTFG